MVKKLTFVRESRLLKPIDFDFVFNNPKSVRISYITILGRINKRSYPRLGMIISKKNVKFSHERNLIKRIIRESFRVNQHNIYLMDFIVIAKKGVVQIDNYSLREVLTKLWHRYYRY
ncbi:ribonuclease P protein component [Candidatus Palibaumannia cicadellinicola]|uniref:Ribonuclease P protein component n=1 Tax=Candidatus Palibaumannia cicadellinicola TaxID=186490 RepID=A0A0K2BKJ2_9GAMM|nr:ribonuclease P protein component [Candidatus Baumannia cicadellinicola]AKZ65732.1 Ribonuclease P protein component [Candidatus Baumannia cicadellinicola]